MLAVSMYIRKLRDASGLSQEEAAVRAEISSKTLGRWEKGASEHEPGISNLRRLVNALGGSAKDALQLLIHIWFLSHTCSNRDRYLIILLRSSTSRQRLHFH